jgi:GTP cyclohydrolase I
MLEDVQNRRDDRQLPIDEVGITGIRYPVAVLDRERGKQSTVADVRMSVDLSPYVKGTHLSRFVEILDESAAEVIPTTVTVILDALRRRLSAGRARVEFRFPYFLRRVAPATGASALMDYQCWLIGEQDATSTTVLVGARVPVTSVCPCSKAISDYGAHNQRTNITISACPKRGEDGEPVPVWADDLIEIAEAAGSCPVYPLVKRPDERHITMQAYDNPVFVEDMARSAAEALARHEQITSFSVEAVSEESIHNHSAFARISSPSPGDKRVWLGGL